jgi:Phage integrase, N-terminal SAM-like domain
MENRNNESSFFSTDPLIAEFLLFFKAQKNVSPHTLINYRHALLTFRSHYPDTDWHLLTADDFRAYLFCLMKANAARSSIRLTFSALPHPGFPAKTSKGTSDIYDSCPGRTALEAPFALVATKTDPSLGATQRRCNFGDILFYRNAIDRIELTGCR